MGPFRVLLITLILASAVESGFQKSKNTRLRALKNSEKDSVAPHTANKLRKKSDNEYPSKTKICNGIVIRETAVITAASCVESLKNAKFIVRSKDGKTQATSSVVNVMPHPMFNKSSQGTFDLAVLELENHLHTVNSTGGLPELRLADGRPRKDSVAYMSNCLGKGMQVTVLSDRQCKLQTGGELGSDEFCAKAPRPKGKKDCLPARGSPIVIGRTLIGVYFTGFRGKAQLKDHNILFFTSVSDHKGWLGDIVAGFINEIDEGIKPTYAVSPHAEELGRGKPEVQRSEQYGIGTTPGTDHPNEKNEKDKNSPEKGSTENYSTTQLPEVFITNEGDRTSVRTEPPGAAEAEKKEHNNNKTKEEEPKNARRHEDSSEWYEAKANSSKMLLEDSNGSNKTFTGEDTSLEQKVDDDQLLLRKEEEMIPTTEASIKTPSDNDDDLWAHMPVEDDPFFNMTESYETEDTTYGIGTTSGTDHKKEKNEEDKNSLEVTENGEDRGQKAGQQSTTQLVRDVENYSGKQQDTGTTTDPDENKEKIQSRDHDRKRPKKGRSKGTRRINDEKRKEGAPQQTAQTGSNRPKSSKNLLKEYGLGALYGSDENIRKAIEEGMYFNYGNESLPQKNPTISQTNKITSSPPSVSNPKDDLEEQLKNVTEDELPETENDFEEGDENATENELDTSPNVPEMETATANSEEDPESTELYDYSEAVDETEESSDPEGYFTYQSNEGDKGQNHPGEYFIFQSPKGTIDGKSSDAVRRQSKGSFQTKSLKAPPRIKRRHRLKPKTCQENLVKMYGRGVLADDDIVQICNFLQNYNY